MGYLDDYVASINPTIQEHCGDAAGGVVGGGSE